MDDCSPTHTFPNLHLRQPQPFHIVLPGHQSSELGHSSAQPPFPLPAYHEGFPTLDSQQGEENGVCDLNNLDEDVSMGGHFEGDERSSWLCGIQKDDWNDDVESPSDEYFTKANCYRGHRGLPSYSSCAQLAHNRKASYVGKQATFRSSHGLDDFGCSNASNEEQFAPSEIDTNPWLGLTGESRWRGELGASTVTSQSPLNNRTYIQKLDSFSDAFLSQSKRRLPVITSADAQTWDSALRLNSIDSDSLSPSFPSPPTSNLLSPPPTPLPPSSTSPSKLDSPGGGGLSVHAGAAQGAEAVGTLQFFPVRPQSLFSQNSPGMVWRLPLLSHCLPQLSGAASSSEGCTRGSLSGGGCNTGPNIVPSLLPSSPHLPVLQSRALCQSLHSFLQTAPLTALTSDHQNEGTSEQQGPAVFRSTSQDPGCPVYTGTTFPSMLQRKAHFTPRPLLNPLRRGTGLYSSICHKEAESGAERDESVGVTPYINVGKDFQADIPPCSFDDWTEEWSCDKDESPQEQLLWKPLDELTYDTTVQDQVEKLLQMSSSSCLPGGGTNTELALHCLHRCHGDTMATLEMLLFSEPMPAGDYHYPGADVWTEREKCLFTAALETHGKDFSLIQALVKTKTVAQCVEFYYLSKKLQDKQKTCKIEVEDTKEEEQKKRAPPSGQPISRQIRQENSVFVPSLASFFPCKLCGKMFYKIKSRNAHMKIHRQPQPEEWTERKLQQQILSQALNRASSLMPQPQTLTFSENNVANGNSISLIDTSVADHSGLLAYSSSTSHVIPNMNTGGQASQEPNGVVQFQTMWGSSEGGADSVKWK